VLTDKLIEFRIRGMLGGLNDKRGLAPDLRISVDAGNVSLDGIAGDSEIAHMIERTVRQTEGVIEIDNKMRIMPVVGFHPSTFVPDYTLGKRRP
jgi:osmotically-inducible protein OsmY